MPVSVLVCERVQTLDDRVASAGQTEHGKVAHAIEHVVVVGAPLVALDYHANVLVVSAQLRSISCNAV